MFEETVTTKAGTQKRVVAGSEEELRDAVEAAKNERAPRTVDINVPVRKGHDLLTVEADGVTQGLADGTGAHNSPRDAVRDDGTVEGDPDVPVLVQRQNIGTTEATNDSLQKLGKDGELSDFTAEDAQKANDASNPNPPMTEDTEDEDGGKGKDDDKQPDEASKKSSKASQASK